METTNKNLNTELNYGIDCPYIDVQWQKGRFFVSNAVFRLLGKPSGIRLWWNNIKSTLIIEPTTINDPDGFPVIGQTYVKNGSLFIGSITLIDKIWTELNWDKTLRYKIVAKYNQSSNVAIFEMEKASASEIPRNIYNGNSKKTLLENIC